MDGNQPSGTSDDLASSMTDDAIRRLYFYWNAKRGSRRFPARRDIDPIEFTYILGWVILADVTYDPLRFYIRLYGSELARRAGFDITGTWLDEHPQPAFREYVDTAWRATVERGEMTHGFFDRWVDDRRFHYESLRLPLSSDGKTIDMLLVAIRHQDN